MLVPMQHKVRPSVNPMMPIIAAWVIWGGFLLTIAAYYYVGWVMPHSPRDENSSAPVNAMTIGAGITGGLSLALNLMRRTKITNLGKKFIVMIIGAALAETVALYGFTIKFVFNTALDRALILLILCIMLHLLNIPTDFKMPNPPPLPGTRDDLGMPPPTG